MILVIAASLLSLAAGLILLRPGANPSTPSAGEGAAERMWASVFNSTESEHELKALETTLRQNPDHAPILLRMAQISRELGKREESLRHLQQAVKVDPKNKEARLELGRALFESGDVDGAIRETQQLLEIDPSNIDGLYNLGAIYGNLGQNDRAREYWRKAVAVDPGSEGSRRAEDALKQIGG
jgi:tetratricopeptide (TPR) repeat protein